MLFFYLPSTDFSIIITIKAQIANNKIFSIKKVVFNGNLYVSFNIVEVIVHDNDSKSQFF